MLILLLLKLGKGTSVAFTFDAIKNSVRSYWITTSLYPNHANFRTYRDKMFAKHIDVLGWKVRWE